MLSASFKFIECTRCGTIVGVHLNGVCMECWEVIKIRGNVKMPQNEADITMDIARVPDTISEVATLID